MNEPTPVDVRRISWWPPSWVVRTTLGAVFLAALGIFVAWYEVNDARTDARFRCERAVTVRHETRAMWLELFEAFPESAEETGLRVDLESLLPPLVCVDNTPIPEPLEAP